MQGIAAAMQGEGVEEEGAPGVGRTGTKPDGASAVGEEGRATSPDAGADQKLWGGDRIQVIASGSHGTVKTTIDGTDHWVNLDGNDGDFVYQRHELKLVSKCAWPFPKVGAP